MATISFSRPMTVNKDWGVKNLEKAIDNPVCLSEKIKKTSKVKMATEADYERLKEKLSQ